MKLVGIAGTDGSGKDTVTEVLAKQGWLYVSLSEILRDEAKKRGMELSRRNLRLISAEWRRSDGLGILIDKAVEHYSPRQKQFKGLVVASLRNPGEADEVHRLGGLIVWVDADSKVRYDRIMNRRRGAEDEVSYEEFLAEEKSQMKHHDSDEATLNLGDVKAIADLYIENNGSDIDSFKKEVQKILEPLLID